MNYTIELKKYMCVFLSIGLLFLVGCNTPENENVEIENEEIEVKEEEKEEVEEVVEESMKELVLLIDGNELEVKWEDNDSIEALKEVLEDGDLEVDMEMYGGFEQVGSLGTTLPSNDTKYTSHAGDIVLYASNQIVIFYGSNSWAYTKLGEIQNKSQDDLEEILGNGDVTVTLGLK